MFSQVWSIGIQKLTNIIQHHEKNDRNEINSVDDHRTWLCIRVTFFSLIGKVFELPAD